MLFEPVSVGSEFPRDTVTFTHVGRGLEHSGQQKRNSNSHENFVIGLLMIKGVCRLGKC